MLLLKIILLYILKISTVICWEVQKGHIIFWTISCKIDHCALYTINKWHELEQRNKESNPLWPSKLVASCLSWFGGSSRSGPAERGGANVPPPRFCLSRLFYFNGGGEQIMPTRLVFLLRIFIPSVGSESNVFVNIHASSKRLVQVSFSKVTNLFHILLCNWKLRRWGFLYYIINKTIDQWGKILVKYRNTKVILRHKSWNRFCSVCTLHLSKSHIKDIISFFKIILY